MGRVPPVGRALSVFPRATLLACALLALAALLPGVHGVSSFKDLESEIYLTLTGMPCTRLLNNRGTIGCGFPMGDVYGPLYLMLTDDDVSTFFSPSFSREAFIVVLSTERFTQALLTDLSESGRLKGALVLDGPVPTVAASPDSPCPLSAEGLIPSGVTAPVCVPWNPHGNSMAFASYRFPIFALSANESSEVLARALRNKRNGYSVFPRYAAQLNAFMQAAGDSGTCLRRMRCDPLGGFSAWTAVGGPVSTNEMMTYVLVSAAMDSSAFFHDQARGARDNASGLAALLALALSLRNATATHAALLRRQIIVAAFTGESWGYYGSGRFANDIASPFKCKTPGSAGACENPFQYDMAFTALALDRIEAMIDMRQIGAAPAAGVSTVYAHIEERAATGTGAAQLRARVAATAAAAGYSVLPGKSPAADNPNASTLPPSSTVPFLRKRPELPALVLTEHEGAFTNGFYHSSYDRTAQAAYVCTVANVAARAAFAEAIAPATEVPADVSVPCKLVETLLHCLVEDFDCELAAAALGGAPGVTHPSYYSSIYRPGIVMPHAKFAKEVLGLASDGNSHYHPSFSLGLAENYDTGGYTVIDGGQANWAESMWEVTNVRVFLQDSPRTEGLVLGLGLFVACATVAASYGLVRVFRGQWQLC